MEQFRGRKLIAVPENDVLRDVEAGDPIFLTVIVRIDVPCRLDDQSRDLLKL
jgi:hypothetical protein